MFDFRGRNRINAKMMIRAKKEMTAKRKKKYYSNVMLRAE